MSRAPKEFDDVTRNMVKRMAVAGVPHDTICLVCQCDKKTLYKYCRKELDESLAVANANVAGALYKNAIEGNVTAQIFWCKTKLGWKEVERVELAGHDGGPLVPVVNIGIKASGS